MSEKTLEEMTRTELYLELQRGRVAETEGKVRKQNASAEIHRRFPVAAASSDGDGAVAKKRHGKS